MLQGAVWTRGDTVTAWERLDPEQFVSFCGHAATAECGIALAAALRW